MDLPPWDETSGTRVWPNIVQLPEGYPFRYLALMMDRYNYPGLVRETLVLWSYLPLSRSLLILIKVIYLHPL